MDLGLHDRVFVVTGGSRGIGRATADALVAEGARVVLSARTPESVDTAVDALGDAAVGVVADLADPTTPQRLVDTAHERFGRLDGALLSVGGPPAGTVLETSDETWVRAFETVFLGTLRAARTVTAALGDGGSVALVLSTSVRSPLANLAISNGLRPGLGMLVKTLADEVGPRGVRVNAVLPGRIDTERLVELDGATPDPARTRREHEAGIPLRRYGQPEELGRVAAFLLSPAASYVTGTMVPVDGGVHRTL
ncbi:SDR family oxidoreductase [Nocardioides caldifontis]|uniref:SDR family oxidoreductase n=1 Tax=Nocardioides caldifontis TaxID=2588938 RepID=UPI0011DFFFE8|nr:SDR family oxidoreductase [Nocardioides caldifontis]